MPDHLGRKRLTPVTGYSFYINPLNFPDGHFLKGGCHSSLPSDDVLAPSLRESTLLEEKVLYRTLKGSISTTYLEPLKGSIHS